MAVFDIVREVSYEAEQCAWSAWWYLVDDEEGQLQDVGGGAA